MKAVAMAIDNTERNVYDENGDKLEMQRIIN